MQQKILIFTIKNHFKSRYGLLRVVNFFSLVVLFLNFNCVRICGMENFILVNKKVLITVFVIFVVLFSSCTTFFLASGFTPVMLDENNCSFDFSNYTSSCCNKVSCRKGDMFSVSLDKTAGSVWIKIYSMNDEGNALWNGDDASTGKFELAVDNDDVYYVWFKGRHAFGKFRCSVRNM